MGVQAASFRIKASIDTAMKNSSFMSYYYVKIMDKFGNQNLLEFMRERDKY